MSRTDPPPDPFDALRTELRRSAPSPVAPSGAKDRVRAGVERRVDAARRYRTTRGYFLAAAAAALVVVGMSVLRNAPDNRSALPTTREAPSPPATSAVHLPSGARIVVRSGSVLTTVKDDPSETTLRLARGEILVHVSHREGRVFEVLAREVRVRVVGTIFAVRNDEDGVAVRVIEGIVRVVQGTATSDVVAGSAWPAGAAAINLTDGEIASVRAAAADAGLEVAPAPPPEPAPSMVAPSSGLPPSTATAAAARVRDAGAPAPVVSAATLAYREAKEHERNGETARARAAYDAIAGSRSEHAEDAQFALGRLGATVNDEGATALDAFARYRARYPDGRYARDVDVHVLAILVQRRDVARILEESSRFLASHADDPRAFRFRLARATVLADRGRCVEALADLRHVQDADLAAPVRRRCPQSP